MTTVRRRNWIQCISSAAVATLIAAGNGALAAAEGVPTGTSIWSGFTQSWDFNHRINRLGDYVKADTCRGSGATCSAKVVHTAASGIAPDNAAAKSYWWQVQASGVGFATTSVTLPIKGRKGTDLRNSETVRISLREPALESLRGRSQYVALLNGFDLTAKSETGDSDKLVKFDLKATRPSYSAESRAITFKVKNVANLACTKTAECSKSAKTTSYTLRVQVAVVAGDSGLVATKKSFTRAYSWPDEPRSIQSACGLGLDPQHSGEGDELSLPPLDAEITGSSRTDQALLAFDSIGLKLDADRHMLAFNSAILPGSYDGTSYKFQLDILFKNWAKGMEETHTPFTLCAFGEPGSATWNANVALLQFRNPAKITHNSATCTIKSPGFNKKPTGSEVVCVKKRSFRLS